MAYSGLKDPQRYVPGIGTVAAGVEAGYKVARGVASVTGTLDVATGLSTVVAAVACLRDDPSTGGLWASVTNASTPGTITLKVWKPTAANDVTPVAATAAKVVQWIAVGT